MYFGLTERAVEVLRDGQRRIWETGAVNDSWDGTWTLLVLLAARVLAAAAARAALAAGLGRLRSAAGRAVDRAGARRRRADIVGGLGARRARAGVPGPRPTSSPTSRRMVGDAYDLDGLAARYDDFLAPLGTGGRRRSSDPIARAAHARRRVAAGHPARSRGCPSSTCRRTGPPCGPRRLFRELEVALDRPARAAAAALLDTRPDQSVS